MTRRAVAAAVAGSVVVESAAQAALVALASAWPEGLALAVALSALAAAGGLAVVLALLSAGRASRIVLAIAAVVAVVAVSAGDVLHPIAGAAVAVVTLPVLAGIAAGRSRPGAVAEPFRRHPVAAVAAVVVSAATLVVLAVASLLLGLFVAGWASAAAVWLLTGASVALLLAWWVRLHRPVV